jgi:hypothetical protein
VVCAGPACAKSCLSDLAVAGSYYLPSAWPEALERQNDLAWSSRLRVSHVVHREVVPSGLVPDPSTFDPAGAVVDESAGTVTWTADLLSDRSNIRSRIRPMAMAGARRARQDVGRYSVIATVAAAVHPALRAVGSTVEERVTRGRLHCEPL